MQDNADDGAQRVGDADADEARRQPDDESLRIEEVPHVLLPCAEGAQHADLFDALHDGDVGDDADHDGRDDEGDRRERDKHIGDDVDHRLHDAHEHAHRIGIGDLIPFRQGDAVVGAPLLAPGVPRVEIGKELFLVVEVVGVDGDAADGVAPAQRLDGGVRRLPDIKAEALELRLYEAVQDIFPSDGSQIIGLPSRGHLCFVARHPLYDLRVLVALDVSLDRLFCKAEPRGKTAVGKPVLKAQDARNSEIHTLALLRFEGIIAALAGITERILPQKVGLLRPALIFRIDFVVIKEGILLAEDIVIGDLVGIGIGDRFRVLVAEVKKLHEAALVEEPELRERQVGDLVVLPHHEDGFVLVFGEVPRDDVVLRPDIFSVAEVCVFGRSRHDGDDVGEIICKADERAVLIGKLHEVVDVLCL